MLMRLVVLGLAAVAIWSWLGRRRERQTGEDVEQRWPNHVAETAELPAGLTEMASRAQPAASTGAATANAGGATPVGAAAGAEPARRIKGNVHGDEKLYHLPDDETYAGVIEERLFATREEAEAAGFHHAHQPG